MSEKKKDRNSWQVIVIALLGIGVFVGMLIIISSAPTGMPRTELEVGARYENQDLPPNLLFLRKIDAINEDSTQKYAVRLYQIKGMEKDAFPKDFLVAKKLKDGRYEIISYKPIGEKTE
jgi:hypothetical protein